MINITNNIAKQNIRAALVRQMMVLENTSYREIKPLLGAYFRQAAKWVKMGILDIDQGVSGLNPRMNTALTKLYKRAYMRFGQIAFTAFLVETKAIDTVYEKLMVAWAAREAIKKVIRLATTTRTIINKIIRKGQTDGLSHTEIAKEIVKKSNKINIARAKTIVRTEIHTVAQRATQTMMEATKQIKEKEWVAVGDSRTRYIHQRANGERVGINDTFTRTGESLMYPGDPNGSARNIVNCRCVTMYHTIVNVINR